MRSRLTCLTVAYCDRPEVGQRARAAWSGLSSACHHHAYELTPTSGEAAVLLDEVIWLDSVHEEQMIRTTRTESAADTTLTGHA